MARRLVPARKTPVLISHGTKYTNQKIVDRITSLDSKCPQEMDKEQARLTFTCRETKSRKFG